MLLARLALAFTVIGLIIIKYVPNIMKIRGRLAYLSQVRDSDGRWAMYSVCQHSLLSNPIAYRSPSSDKIIPTIQLPTPLSQFRTKCYRTSTSDKCNFVTRMLFHNACQCCFLAILAFKQYLDSLVGCALRGLTHSMSKKRIYNRNGEL